MDPAAMSGWLMPFSLPAAFSSPWTPFYWLIAFFMWAVMMVAMMLPSASPMVLLYARVVRQAERQGRVRNVSASIAAFASGYLTLWILFSGAAVIVQYVLERTAALSAMMSSRSILLSGTAPRRRGPLPADAAQGRLPQALPRTGSLHRRSLASRRGRRLAHGALARRLLRRLLRSADAASLRRRRDELDLDRGPHAPRRDREARSVRTSHGKSGCGGAHNRRRAPRSRGPLEDCPARKRRWPGQARPSTALKT